MRLYDPRADIVFRKIFGTHKNMYISLLNSLLPLAEDEKIVSIEYYDPDILPDCIEFRNSVVDVLCTDQKERTFLVDMQMYWNNAYLMRALFNASKAFASQSEPGLAYKKLQPVYSLCLLNENMPDTREYKDEYTHTYYIQHEHHKELRIGGMIFVFVELLKYKSANRVHQRLADLWLTFLTFCNGKKDVKVPDVLRTDPIVSSALDCLQNMYLSESERLAYDKYWDMVSYNITLKEGWYEEGVTDGIKKGREEGRAEGREEGRAEGREEGRAEGREEGRAEGREEGRAEAMRIVAKNLKDNGVSVNQIAISTGLSIEEVEKL